MYMATRRAAACGPVGVSAGLPAALLVVLLVVVVFLILMPLMPMLVHLRRIENEAAAML